MSTMTIGELVGYVGLDVDELERGADRGERSVQDMARAVLAEAKKLEREKFTVHLDAEIRDAERKSERLRARLTELGDMEVSPEVEAETAQAERNLAKIERDLAKLRGQRVQVEVDVIMAGLDDGALGDRDVSIRADTSDLARANRELEGFNGHASTAARNALKVAEGLGKMAPAAAGFSAVGLVPVLMGTVSALAATNGVLGLLPAVAFSAATGIGALKVGMTGFGDAMKNLGDPKKFAESLEKLSPAARATAIAIRDIAPAWKAMASTVQERLFDGLAKKVSALAEDYLPMLGAAFGTVADGANQAASGVLLMLNETSRMDDVEGILNSSAGAWKDILSAIGPVVAALIDIGAVGAPILAELTAGTREAAMGWQQMIAQARESGRLEEWIRGGIRAFGDLVLILRNLGSIIASVFRAANQDGEGLLATVADLTAQWAEWARSAEGQARMGEVLGALNTILQTTSEVMGTILPIVADLIVWFSQLPAPVQQAVVAFVMWGALLGKVASGLAPLISGLRLFGTALGGIGGPIIRAAASWGLLGTAAKGAGAITGSTVGGILRTMATAAGGMMVRAIAMAAAWLVAMGPVGWAIAAVIAAAALIIYYWDEIKAALLAAGQWLGELFTTIGTWLLNLGVMIATQAYSAWNWLVTTLQDALAAVGQFLLDLPMNVAYALGYLAGLVLNGALAAWRWLSETLPLVIAQVVAWLAALPGRVLGFLTNLGNTVRQGAHDAFMWLVTKTIELGSQAVAWVAGLPGRIASFVSQLPGIIRNAATSAWQGFVTTTMSLAGQALAFIASVPGRVTGLFASAGSWLVSAGANIIIGLWNGLKSMAQAVLDWIANLASQIASGFAAAVGIHSPSKVFAEHGGDIGKGLLVGLSRIGPSVVAAAQDMAYQVEAAAQAGRASAVAQAQPSDIQRAAQEILGHIAAGGRTFEDLTWKGASSLVGANNDQLLDMAEASGVNLGDPAAMQRFLQGVAAPKAQSQVTVNVYNPQAERTSTAVNREARTLSALGVL